MTNNEELIAEAQKCAPGDCSTELAVMVHRLADALEATLGEPTEAHDTGMGSVDWDMIRDGVADPEEAASVAVRAALKAAGVVPVRGEPNDDREALARLIQRFEECDNPDYLLADFLLGKGLGFSRASVPDAATELIAAIADELTPGRRDKDLIISARGHKAERDAAVAAIERVRKLHEPHEALPLGCEYCGTTDACDTRKALDGAPEPEDEEEEYQAGCGSWDCRAPECGRA